MAYGYNSANWGILNSIDQTNNDGPDLINTINCTKQTLLPKIDVPPAVYNSAFALRLPSRVPQEPAPTDNLHFSHFPSEIRHSCNVAFEISTGTSPPSR